MTSMILRQRATAPLLVFTAVTPSAAAPFDFSFGISPVIVAPPEQTTVIPAAIVNRLSTPLVFNPFVFGVRTDCPFFGCSGSSYGASAGPAGGLNFEFLDPRGDLFHAQFNNLAIQPGERFDFSFGTIRPDPIGSRFNPTGTNPLQFGFTMFRDEALVNSVVITGGPTSLAPLEFALSQGPPPFFPGPDPAAVVPEPTTLILVGTGAAGVGLARWWKRRSPKHEMPRKPLPAPKRGVRAMDGRAFISGLTLGLLAAPLAAEAQQPLGETALDKQDPLLLLAFLFIVVVLFLLCAGLLMLVFRRYGMLKTDPSLPLSEVLLHEAIEDEESIPSDSAQPSGGGGPGPSAEPGRT